MKIVEQIPGSGMSVPLEAMLLVDYDKNDVGGCNLAVQHWQPTCHQCRRLRELLDSQKDAAVNHVAVLLMQDGCTLLAPGQSQCCARVSSSTVQFKFEL